MDIATVCDPPPGRSDFADRLRLPFSFDPALLVGDLNLATGPGWIKHFVTQNYEGDWSVLPLRAPAGATHPVMMIYADPCADRFEDTPILAQTPYFQTVLAAFACPLQAVRLMRLTAGSTIKTHNDLDLAHEHGTVRIHVPIVTDPAVEFLLNGTAVSMAPGEAWYLRLSDPHSVHNRSQISRVHLVIDALVNDWLTDTLRRASVA